MLARSMGGRDPLLARCSDTGAFRLGPVAPGRHVLSLAFPPPRLDTTIGIHIGRSGPAAEQRVADVELSAGENRLDVNLIDVWPGALDVEVVLDGVPAPEATLVEVRADGSDDVTPVVGLVGSDGVARFDSVPRGAVRMVVSPSDRSWQFRVAEPVRIEPASLNRARADVALHEGTVRILRKNRTPLASSSVQIGYAHRSNATISTSRNTDGAGRLTLRLPEGRFLLGQDFHGKTREVEWTERGPIPAEIVLDEE
jgi:hypothetical protein